MIAYKVVKGSRRTDDCSKVLGDVNNRSVNAEQGWMVWRTISTLGSREGVCEMIAKHFTLCQRTTACV